MKPIDQDELYQNLRGFLKNKGIDLQKGSYARGIQKSCSLLTDAINLGQQGFERAKVGIDKKLDEMRQVIHEKTAPRTKTNAAAASASTPKAKPTAKAQRKKRASRKTKK
jgi:hypothetical protein